MTVQTNGQLAVARIAVAISHGVTRFLVRYAPEVQPPADRVRRHVAQGLLDGEVAAFGCAILDSERSGGERTVLAAVRFHVAQRPFPAERATAIGGRVAWNGPVETRLFVEPSRTWHELESDQRNWFFASVPLRWKQADEGWRFAADLHINRVEPFGDSALIREWFDIGSVAPLRVQAPDRAQVSWW